MFALSQTTDIQSKLDKILKLLLHMYRVMCAFYVNEIHTYSMLSEDKTLNITLSLDTLLFCMTSEG